MARLCASGIAFLMLALVWAAHMPAFNSALPSPSLVTSLTADYVAVDARFGAATNPYTIDTVLHRQGPPPITAEFGIPLPRLSVTTAAAGVYLAQQAEGAAASLGATAELVPVRQELLESFQDVEHAWQTERQVEQAVARGGPTTLSSLGDSPSVLAAANASAEAMRQARSLHDQAMTAVRVLSGKPATGSSVGNAATAGRTPPSASGNAP